MGSPLLAQCSKLTRLNDGSAWFTRKVNGMSFTYTIDWLAVDFSNLVEAAKYDRMAT